MSADNNECSPNDVQGTPARGNLQAELAALRQTCARQQAQMQEIQTQLLEVLNSTWWRIGEPLRRVGRRYPKLARTLRFMAWSSGKFYYYSRKGVLRERLADYLRRRALLAQARNNDLVKALGLPQEQKPQKSLADIMIPGSENPIVSVIIPAYGQVEVTLRCLSSIANAPPVVPIEVLVAEDASGDPNVQVYKRIAGLRYIEHAHNLGFLRSCNEAVKHARGKFVFLLNNDTELVPGAIDALVKLFRSLPDVGMVGARLIYPDGRQQEAGGIIWQDGLAWNYSRFDDPRRPEYNYVREVDYVSGAAIMLPRVLWDHLGGFDEQFSPAYYEDSDLAFRVRREGLKVLYQPKALVIHHEGSTHGVDTQTGLKVYQLENARKFAERWKDLLAKEHLPSGTRIMRARDRSIGKKITLVIDHYVPEPDRDAGSRAIMNCMETLLGMGRVVKFWPSNNHESPAYSAVLQQMGIEVLYGPWSGPFDEWIKKNGAEIDEVLLSRPMVAPMFLPALRKYSRARIVFYGIDLHFMRMEKEAEVTRDRMKLTAAQEMKELERRVWLSVDHVLYLSKEEVKAVAEVEPSVHVSAVSPYVFNDAIARPAPPAGNEIIFVAGFRHSPNPDGAAWFCSEILPLIRASIPDIQTTLIGSHPTGAVQALAGEDVHVTGHISDDELVRRYAGARVAIAPLRFGAGVKLKVVEALRYGAPMVTTNVGIQGLEGLEKIIDVCDDPADFAKAVLRLLEDDALWIARSSTQADYVTRNFSSARMREGLEAAFTSVFDASYKAVA